MKQAFIIGLAGMLLFACSQTKKDMVEMQDVTTSLTTEVPGQRVYLDKNKNYSHIQYTGYKKIGTKETGKAFFKDGFFIVNDGAVLGGQFIVDLTSLTNESNELKAMQEKFLEHIKSADFFEVETFPTASFIVTEVIELSEKDNLGHTHSITGNLTIRGLEKQITVPADIEMDGRIIKMITEFTFDRTVFGLSYGVGSNLSKAAADEIISDAVNLRIVASS